jgi:hypothetical protein
VELSAHLFFPLIPFRLLALYGSAFNHTLDELFGRLLRSSEKPGLLNAPLLLEKNSCQPVEQEENQKKRPTRYDAIY